MILIIGAAYFFALFKALRTDSLRSGAALGLSVIIGGLLYWTIPYSKMNVTSGFFLAVFYSLGLIAGLAVMRWLRLAWPKSSSVVGLGFVTAVTARAVYDAFRDPESHSLFFMEVAIAFMVGFVGSSIAAIVGHLLRRRHA